MNDDHMDGATAFPYLELRVSPEKGSALFWFTLTPTGQSEYGTRFTQCPVIHKSKWIATKNIFVQGRSLWQLDDDDGEDNLTSDDYDRHFF